MKVYQFAYILGLNALVSLGISLGVTDFMLNQRDKAEVKEVPISPEVRATAERNKLLAEAKVLLSQAELDESLSRYSGVEVIDAYKMDDIIEVKLQIEEGRRFCSMNNAQLTRIKFYEQIKPYVKCSNGVTD